MVKDAMYLLPRDIMSKAKGEEAGQMILKYLLARIESKYFWIAYPHLFRIIHDYSKGLFWRPASKENGYEGIPEWQRQVYDQVSQTLWDLLNIKENRQLIVLLLAPNNLGYHGTTPVYCVEGDGITAIWAIMMHCRPCNSVHVRGLNT